MITYSNAPFKELPKNFILFIYRGKGGACNIKTIYRKLHGHTEERSTKDKFGRAFHKKYDYLGTPHNDIIPGAFFVAAKDEKEMMEFFKKYRVPYIKIRPKTIESSNWYVHTAGEKLP